MTARTIELTRRKILGSTGAISPTGAALDLGYYTGQSGHNDGTGPVEDV